MRKSIIRGIMAVLLCTVSFSCIEAADVMAASSDEEECICEVACRYEPNPECPVCMKGVPEALGNCKGEIVKYTVYYDVQGGECGNFSEEVPQNDYASLGDHKLYLSKDGFQFGGWYRDPECTEPWNMNHDLVKGDMTLYAKWIKKEGIGFDDDSPDSSNTKVWSVTVYYSNTARPDGNNEINVIVDNEPAYPEASDIDILLADDERYWMRDNRGNISSEKYFATVENLTSNDGGRTWTFTVRAADGTTTEDYTLHVKLTSETEYCGHDSYEWINYDDYGRMEPVHMQKCTVCGKYNPDTIGYHEWEIVDEGYHPTFEKEGLEDLERCKICGVYGIDNGYAVYTIFEDGDDIEDARRIPSRNELRAESGKEPLKDSLTDYAGRPEEDLIEGQNSTQTIGPNGTWFQDAIGWWFEKYEGGYPSNCWYECRTSAGGNWYHFDASGYMQTGWFTDADGNVYYLSTNQGSDLGRMYTGWNWIDGKCYYFNMNSGYAGYPAGALMRNMTTPDGFTVDATGAWTVNGVVQLQTQ